MMTDTLAIIWMPKKNNKTMLSTHYENISISGLATVLPENKVSVDSYAKVFGEETVTKFKAMTGVESFYRSDSDQTASDMAYIAARKLIATQDIDINDIGICLFVTQKPDFRVPGPSYIVHRRLGLTANCSCYDINLACSGFVFALNSVSAMLQHTSKKYALVLTGDTSHRTMAPEDRTMIMLFGDNGTATLVERKEENNSKLFFGLRSQGSKFKSIITPAGAYRNIDAPTKRTEWSDGISRSDYDTHMKGMDVFGFSITDVPKLIKDFLANRNLSPEDIDFFALHQPNMYMLKQIARKIKAPMEKMLVSLDRYGNNSSSSIPLVLSDHFGNMRNKRVHIAMCGFGGGLSYGCADTKISVDGILGVEHSNETFKA